jgi:hypothetical protein
VNVRTQRGDQIVVGRGDDRAKVGALIDDAPQRPRDNGCRHAIEQRRELVADEDRAPARHAGAQRSAVA